MKSKVRLFPPRGRKRNVEEATAYVKYQEAYLEKWPDDRAAKGAVTRARRDLLRAQTEHRDD